MPKISPKHYASALLDVVDSGVPQAQALSGLFRAMSTHGDMGRRGEVLSAVERESAARAGACLVNVQFAQALGVAERKEFLSAWGEKDRVSTTVNPDLVAGVRVLVNGDSELDLSLRAKLDKVLAI